MVETINKLEELLIILKDYIANSSSAELSQKPSPQKWSKKEIIGHLIDSGIYNLRRFAEIQFQKKPYIIRPYDQVELVKVNNYQNSIVEVLVDILVSINRLIKNLMILQTAETLDYKIEYAEGTMYADGSGFDLRFLMKDYVSHFEHHMNQIVQPLTP